MGASLSRKDRSASRPSYDSSASVPACAFKLEAAVPPSERRSYSTMQAVIASAREPKLEATPASAKESKSASRPSYDSSASVTACAFKLEAAVPPSERRSHSTMQALRASAREPKLEATRASAKESKCAVTQSSGFAVKTTSSEITYVASDFTWIKEEAEASDFTWIKEEAEASDFTWIKEEAEAIHIPQKSYADHRLLSVVSIFRVPNFLKDTKYERAYVPQAVSLGPYHSNRLELSPMYTHKKRALHRMMTRFDNNNRHPIDSDNMNSSVRAIEKIFEDVDNIGKSYEEKMVCTPRRLAVMLTLDGCFILEILRTLGGDQLNWEGRDYYEPIFDQRKIEFTGFDILNDILMLENQIPLVVFRKLLELEYNSVERANNILFDVLVKTPGTRFYPFDYEDDMKNWCWQPPHEQVHHLLGLLHSLIVSPPSNDGDERAIQIDNNGRKRSWKDDRFIPPAVELSNAGIKFQRCKGGIKKIYFDTEKATIYLPPINVTDHTEVLFRNLIALELYKASGINYVTCYLNLMNKLIDTEKDVAVLRHSGVLKNYIGSDAEVAALFNGLCKGVALPREDIFQRLQDDVMKHYGSKFKVWFAQFIKDYFSSPWKFLALFGAIVALLLTMVQTVFSILQVHK